MIAGPRNGWRSFRRAAALAAAIAGVCLRGALAGDAGGSRAETVRFANPRWPTVTIVRGTTSAAPAAQPAAPLFRATPANTQIVSFGDGTGRTVAVVRGSPTEPAAPAPVDATQPRVQTVRFADPLTRPVNIIRGGALLDPEVALFGPADDSELNRVAFAVDGVESGHGRTPLMWRDDLDGPQGPMQVSAAAALDVGGGDRFNLAENRQIGRAFLAQLYQRYGNWPDAIAAYNWGPGHVDHWIATGRPLERLPLETARYLKLVLRDAFLTGTPQR
jgi:hypothetical protein